jgi:hypothetical protein
MKTSLTRRLRAFFKPVPEAVPFAADAQAHRLCKMMEALQRGAYVPPSVREEVDRLTEEVKHDIRSGRLLLDYAPAHPDAVSLPGVDDMHYMQAVLYWSGRLDGPLPRVIEACARAGDGASLAIVAQTMARIELENRMSQTDVFFARAPRK